MLRETKRPEKLFRYCMAPLQARYVAKFLRDVDLERDAFITAIAKTRIHPKLSGYVILHGSIVYVWCMSD